MQARHNAVSFFGLGSRSAAKALYAYISEHPEACIGGRDTNFFADSTQFAKGRSWYESTFPNCPAGSLRGELSTNYLASGQAAALIARTYPSAKLIALIQNPLVCVRVEYLEAILQRKIKSTVSLATFLKQNPEVLLRAKIGRQLVPYFSYYSHNDLMVILEEDSISDPLTVTTQVYGHLGFTTPFVPESLRHLVVEEEEEVKKRPGIIKRSFRAIKRGLKAVYLKLRRLIKPPVLPEEALSSRAKRIPLSPELEQYLLAYYRADVEQLASLLRRNVDVEWGFTTDQ